MQTVVIVLHLMIVSALTVVVLLQKSEGGGLGMGGGFMSSRGTANLLTRTTAFLAAGFFLTSLFLSWLAGYEHKPGSILDTAPVSQSQPAPVAPPASGGLLDSLKQSEQPAAPAPAGPQAPSSQ